MTNAETKVYDRDGGENTVPVHRPRRGESADECAARLGGRILERREERLASDVIFVVRDGGLDFEAVKS